MKSSEVNAYLAESRDLGRDLLAEIATSRKRAWRVAGAGGVLAALGLVAGLAGFLRDAPPPVVLRVDNATGAVDVLVTAGEERRTWGEIVDGYWLARYVELREGYDWHTIQRSYDAVGLMSDDPVARDYRQLFEGDAARDQALGRTRRRLVTVLSITPGGDGGSASVRFVTEVRNDQDQGVEPAQHWIATVGYRYVQGPMAETDRRINPLGFQVTSYRAVPETGEDRS